MLGSNLSELPYGDSYLFSHFTDEEIRADDMRVTCLEQQTGQQSQNSHPGFKLQALTSSIRLPA